MQRFANTALIPLSHASWLVGSEGLGEDAEGHGVATGGASGIGVGVGVGVGIGVETALERVRSLERLIQGRRR